MYIFRSMAKKLLSETVIIRINPQKLQHYCEAPFYDTRESLKHRFGKPAGRFLGDLMLWRSLFNPGGPWDTNTTAITELEKYQNMKDLWAHNKDFYNSGMYRDMYKQLQHSGQTKYKKKTFRDRAGLDAFFENYLLAMLWSMYRNGYDESLDSEIPRAAIDREGRLVKTRRGRHRFSAAAVTGAKQIPLEIDNIHPLFLQKTRSGFSGKRLKRLKSVIQKVENDYS